MVNCSTPKLALGIPALAAIHDPFLPAPAPIPQVMASARAKAESVRHMNTSEKCLYCTFGLTALSYCFLRTTRHPRVEPPRLFSVISIVSSLEFSADSRTRHTASLFEQARRISIVRSSCHLDDCMPEQAKS